MDKGKRFVQYLCVIIVVLLFLYWGSWYGFQLKAQWSETYNAISYYRYFIFSAVFPILFGIILAIPNLLQKFQQFGKWTINWMMLFVIGVPTLLIDLNQLIYALTPIGKIQFFLIYNPFYKISLMDKGIITLSGTIFGYILISSLIKRVPINQN